MYPVLFHIGPIPIYGYGFMLALGFIACMFLAQRDARHFKIAPEKLTDLFPLLILAAAIGARLFHVVVERPSYFIQHPIDIFKLWDGGVTFYGGVMFALLAGWIFARRNKMSTLYLFDFLVPYLALGEVFGRLGCFLAGCCHGVPTDLPWGIAVTNPMSVTRPLGIPLHPTQLYQVAWNLLTFIVLYRTSFRKKFTGQSLLLYGILYPIGRSVIEIFRGDEVRGYIIEGVITTSQGISILIFATCVTIYAVRHFKTKKEK